MLRYALLLFSLFYATTLSAQKAKPHQTVVDAMVAQLRTAVPNNKSNIRIAIVPFTNTKADEKIQYTDYITETLTGKLAQHTNTFQLFERGRLDAILTENKLMLSGLMKPSEAIKIGELLSVDALFSGTITKLKSYIEVNGRLLDVASGEILTSFSGRVKIDKNIAVLTQPLAINNQPNVQAVTTQTQPKEKGTEPVGATENACPLQHTVKDKLSDLSSEEKINELVNTATTIPFDLACGKIHYDVISRFIRYKVDNKTYRDFLLKTWVQIPHPSQDDRSLYMLEYLALFNGIDDEEWKAWLQVITKVEYYHYRYISLAFKHDAKDESQQKKLFKRIDEYFDLQKQGALGKPTALTYNQSFFGLMQGLDNTALTLSMYAYENYREGATAESVNSISQHMLYLNKLYEKNTDKAAKSKVMDWMIDYFKKFEYEKTADQLYDVAFRFAPEVPQEWNEKMVAEKNKEKAEKFLMEDLQKLIRACSDLFARYATQSPYPSQQQDRIIFCVRYQIPIAGVIPTMDEAKSILKGNDIAEQERVIKLLLWMDTRPKAIENELIQFLNKKSIDQKEKLIDLQTDVMVILGNIKCEQPQAIKALIGTLMATETNQSYAAKKSLQQIGKAALPHLIERLKQTTIHDGGLRYQLIVLIGQNGAAAKQALPLFKKIYQETNNTDIRYAIEAAEQSINEQ
ncbi:MAG: CsgG/HfaB family protein [Chryseotalea sp.]|jgi:TolB-like protein